MSMNVAINVFSVNKQLNEDYFGTLEGLARIGYRYVELIATDMSKKRFSDTITAKELKKKLANLNLTPIASHEGLAPGLKLEDLNWEFIIPYNVEVGIQRIVLPSLRITSREEALRMAEKLNIIGTKCHNEGIQFYIHNHALEFKPEGESTLFHLLLDHTDPKYLKVELDLAWVLRGNCDPIHLLNQLGERCDLVHQRDINKHLNYPLNIFEELTEVDYKLAYHEVHMKYRKPDMFVDLGAGSFDFERVYGKIQELGYVKYTIVESDGDREDKYRSLENDLKLLKQYVGDEARY
ncbi:sugar phosphate isomerase/epimerase family protein [Paenibacillus andongensis]|uniref:sugar phosphate isomerase/epimerase family protein n=1 Tax=Paenibacillus andongensis TaxID=2975482 RepID=UPI0021BB2E09|nr:sugar phosphate isomerase/epimerase [Paenibacillus andongensis]